MITTISKVNPIENYLLELIFENGEKRIVDMKPYLDFGVFKRIKEASQFKKVHISFDTIEWNCGVDLDPEFLYSKCVPLDLIYFSYFVRFVIQDADRRFDFG